MPRLFTALDLTSSFKNSLTHLQRDLPDARWAEVEDFHITLNFIGDVSRDIGNEIVEELALIRVEPFTLHCDEIDFFGSKKPRLLFVKLKPLPALFDLVHRIDTMLRRLGVEQPPRKFIPHITLARLGGYFTPHEVMEYKLKRGLLRLPPQEFKGFSLYSAKDLTGGAPYVRLLDFGQD